MKIRPAAAHDAHDLMRMATAFHAAAGYSAFLPLDLESLFDTIQTVATEPHCALLVAEDDGKVCGMVAAISQSHWLNKHHKIAQELCWWVEESARGTHAGRILMQALEAWATAAGCHTLSMASTTTLKPEAVARIYRRAGFVPQDIFYVKVLNHA